MNEHARLVELLSEHRSPQIVASKLAKELRTAGAETYKIEACERLAKMLNRSKERQ